LLTFNNKKKLCFYTVSWVDWGTFNVFLLYCTCPESDNGEDGEIVKSLEEVGLEPSVYKNPNSETLETVLKDLDNQKELTGTMVLVKDVKKQKNGPVERFMVKLAQLQNLKGKPKVSYCISQKQYY